MSRSALPSRRRAGATWLAAALLLAYGGAVHSESTRYPLTLENCGAIITVKEAPRRVVSVGQTQTEILYALGLSDRVVGTAVWFGPVAAPYRAVNTGVKRLADNAPSFEAVLGEAPDLVTATFAWHIGPHGAVARREQFGDFGVPVYVAPPDCVGKDNSAPGDGVRTLPFAMDLVYDNIRELGQVFDISSRAEALVTDLKAREDAAVASMVGRPARDLSVLVWFSSRDVKGDAFVAGATGVPAYLFDKLGARNVITTNEEWPLVGWESIAAADPTVIVVVRMDRRLFPADDVAVKLGFLRTDPVARRLTAVRENRIVVMDAAATRPGLETIDGIGALAKDLGTLGLAR